jgi:hypothetical protein
MPALMGEVDVLKVLQLMPGVQAASEGSSGFSVRGGGYDQNLMVLDDAALYNVSHLMGFFSVFNNDAISDVKLYKGDIPAAYGGRLSSLVEIRSRDGNASRIEGRGGIGTISSRLTVEGPINDKMTFLASGRRTYADLFLKLANDEDLRKTRLYFYDLNGKLTWRLSDRDRLYASGYYGRDVAGTNLFGIGFGNTAASLRWNHIYSPRLFSNISLTGSFFNYNMSYDATDNMAVEWRSQMDDYGARADFTWHTGQRNTLKFGYEATWHNFSPGAGGGVGESSIFGNISTPRQYAFEQAPYVSAETTAGPLTLRYGARLSMFHNVGNCDTVRYLRDYVNVGEKVIPRGEFYNTQARFEPRLGVNLRLDERNSLKASYSRSAQYIQMASNSTAGSPLDVWFQATQNVAPQVCGQWSLGWMRTLRGGMFELSLEAFYKQMDDVIDFKDHAQLLANDDLETELRFGRGQAWGAEAMLRKNTGKLTGWVSYSFCASRRQIDLVNDGCWYRSPFDKPANISVVLSYDFSPKWNFSANWIYASGTPVTYPTGRFLVENTYVPIYSGRNEYRYPAYHRLDLSATWHCSKPSRRIQSELNFSLYNAYGRKNPWTIMFSQEELQPDVSYAEIIYLFSFVPSVIWNFKF